MVTALAVCFTRIGSTCGTEIYWRSFRHFGNYNYSLGKTAGKKMIKYVKNCAKLRCFFVHFPYSFNRSLKIFAGGGFGEGHSPLVAPPPVYAPVPHAHIFHFSCRFCSRSEDVILRVVSSNDQMDPVTPGIYNFHVVCYSH